MKSPKEIVREGYDTLSVHYRNHYDWSHANVYKVWVAEFAALVPKGARILELGCGDGIPVAHILCQDYDYTGVDISSVQVETAKQNLPVATFLTADMTELPFPDGSFQGVIALYSIIHVPLDEQKELLHSIYHWLQPQGYFLCVLGSSEWTGLVEGWILPEVTMYWSHTNAQTYAQWLAAIGFEVVKEEHIPDDGGAIHAMFLLKKTS